MKSSDLLLYPSISVCSIGNGSSNLIMPYIADGKIFQDKQSYLNYLDTNVAASFDLVSGPNLTVMVHSIDVMDENGTMHVMSPISTEGNNKTIHGYYGFSIDPMGGPGLFVSINEIPNNQTKLFSMYAGVRVFHF